MNGKKLDTSVSQGGQSGQKSIKHRSPTPTLWTGTSPCPVRNWAAQQEVSDRWEGEASSVFAAAPQH